MKKFIVSLIALAVLGLATPARANLIMSIDIGGQTFCAADNNTGCTFGTVILDSDATVGSLSIANQILGGIMFTGSTQLAQYGPNTNILNTSFLQATNTTGSTIVGTVAVSATGFVAPISSTSVSGAATYTNAIGSTASSSWWLDPLNTQGATTPTTLPGTQVGLYNYTVTQLADSFSYNNTTAIAALAPFSMTLGTAFTLTSQGQITNRGMTQLNAVNPVPEPGSMLLIGTGLAFVANRARKRFGLTKV